MTSTCEPMPADLCGKLRSRSLRIATSSEHSQTSIQNLGSALGRFTSSETSMPYVCAEYVVKLAWRLLSAATVASTLQPVIFQLPSGRVRRRVEAPPVIW